MRTKDEIIEVLAKRLTTSMLVNSTWTDLVNSIQVFDAATKDNFVKLVASGNTKKAGEKLKQALYINARSRASTSVEAMLVDDGLDLTEIDSLL